MTETGKDRSASISAVRRFWETHVNNEYYTSAARGSDEYFIAIERKRYRWHYHLRELFDELEGSSGDLLEIGCGIGVDSIQLARAGFDVTAVDLTDKAIEVAKEFAHRRDLDIDFRVGNAEALDFPDGSFDTVYSFGVLHHTPDIRKAIREVHRVLRTGGVALIMLYHRRSLVDLVHRLLRLPYESPRHLKDHCPVVFTFRRTEVVELFRDFEEISIEADYPFTYGFRHLAGWVPVSWKRWLGRRIGWHLMIRAVK